MPAVAARSASETRTSPSSAACSVVSSPWRPSEVRSTTTSGSSSRTHAHLAKEKVEALIVGCSTGGTRKPERSNSASGTSCARKASVTTATLAVSIAASSAAASGATSPSSRAVGAAGVASTTTSASTVSGAVVGPTVSAQPDDVRRSARTVADVRASKPPSSRSRPGSRPMPPGRVAKTGAVETGTAAACSSRLPRRAIASSWGTAAAAEMRRA